MLMSSVAHASVFEIHPELAGRRVVLCGADAPEGAAVAEAFSGHAARLVLQAAPGGLDIAGCEASYASATSLSCIEEHLSGELDTVTFAQRACATHCGLDVLVNIVSLTRSEIKAAIDADKIEDLVAHKLSIALALTRVAANRMALTRVEGAIVHIVSLPDDLSPAHLMVARILRAALAASVRREAQRHADLDIRINGISPPLALPGQDEPKRNVSPKAFAALALRLASKSGKKLSGLMLETDNCAESLVTGDGC